MIKPETTDVWHLKNDLFKARSDILHLMPEEFQQRLWSFFHCESRALADEWTDKTAEEFVRIAAASDAFDGERVSCPLCGSDGVAPRQLGFSVPVGLMRHLTGWGNARQCSVMAAAEGLANNYWRDKFSPARRGPMLKSERRASSDT